MRVTVSGPPGSGKTTAAENVARELSLELILTGRTFRAMAEERGMTLAEFGKLAAEDASIDKELDRRVIGLFADGKLLEGRLAGAMARLNGIPAFKTYITASPAVRAGRIGNREGGDQQANFKAMQERFDIENQRYMRIYGIDPSDRSIYDLWLETDGMDEAQVAAHVVAKVRDWESAGEFRGARA